MDAMQFVVLLQFDCVIILATCVKVNCAFKQKSDTKCTCLFVGSTIVRTIDIPLSTICALCQFSEIVRVFSLMIDSTNYTLDFFEIYYQMHVTRLRRKL